MSLNPSPDIASFRGAIFAFPNGCPNKRAWSELSAADGRVLIGAGKVTDELGNSFASLPGEQHGRVKVVLQLSNMPNHRHDNTIEGKDLLRRGDGAAPVNYSNGLLAFGGGVSIQNGPVSGHPIPVGTPSEGFEIMPPSLTVTFCQFRG